MIPIEYLWYIIGAVSVPAFIMIYLKALRRNSEDKARVALRRKRFERTMKSPHVRKSNTEKLPASERVVSAVDNPPPGGHWLSGVKLPTKREQPASERIASAVEDPETTGHWLAHVKPKRKHWLDNLRR